MLPAWDHLIYKLVGGTQIVTIVFSSMSYVGMAVMNVAHMFEVELEYKLVQSCT
jgi:hypothetical protein